MSAVDEHLQAFDHAWAHDFESIRSALDGVTDDEAYWQADAYADEDVEDGWPAPGTIAWQVAHLAHCKRHYAEFVRTRAAAEPPPVEPRTPLATFAEERAALDAAHAAQRAAIAAVDDADLTRVACGHVALGAFLAMATRHDAWHAGQIAVARRLYRVAHAAS
ncbi:MAG: DinB family protein [Planctomycetota bacterium]|nr:DinB family protein [Planctomycetota bacterium]